MEIFLLLLKAERVVIMVDKLPVGLHRGEAFDQLEWTGLLQQQLGQR